MPRQLLILSDLHAGKDCKGITGFAQQRPDQAFDQAFVDLLDHYTTGHETEFRLIVNGDFIDFLEVVVVPEQHRMFSFEVTDEEREFGLGSEPERAVVKLERTMAYHPRLFERISDFVRRGGELTVVRGNHDVELFWPKVERVFRRNLAESAFRGEKLEVDDAIDLRNEFQTRVQILPWFYFEPGRVYVEHGHQYDTYCSFDHWLHPVSPKNERRIDTPISSFALRYLVNFLTDFDPHHIDFWKAKDYFDWAKRRGVKGSAYVLRLGIGVVARSVRYSLEWTLGRLRTYTQRHNETMKAQSEAQDIPFRTLKALDKLHAVPINRNLPELMSLLFLDRILLYGAALFSSAFFLLVFTNVWLELFSLIAVAGATWRIGLRLAPRHYLVPGPRQKQVAIKIAELSQAQSVIMGHSHAYARLDLPEGRTYINTGCWLPPSNDKDHVDPEAACTCRLSHAFVPETGPAELRIFCKASKTVRVVAPEDGGSHIGPASGAPPA